MKNVEEVISKFGERVKASALSENSRNESLGGDDSDEYDVGCMDVLDEPSPILPNVPTENKSSGRLFET
jgi:hypothetical protein